MRSSTQAAVKPAKIVLLVFAIIASLFLCAFIAACSLRAAQNSDTPLGSVVSARPLPPGKARQTALEAGRRIARLIAQRDSAGLFATFTPEMARQVPQATVNQLMTEGFAPKNDAPVGEIISGSETAPTYLALYPLQNGRGQLSLLVSFSSSRADKVSALLLTPEATPDNQAGVIAQGRTAAALVAKRDIDGLYALFSPSMASALPKSRIVSVMDELIPVSKPVGTKIGEIIVPAGANSGDGLLYAAEFAQGTDNTIKVLMTFTPDNQKLTSIRLVPGLTATLAPDPHAGYQMKTKLHLPFAPGDKWTIFWGGDTRVQNYHVDYADQRHAFDIVATQNGKTHRGDGKELTQYFAWGRKIVAPADATVQEAVDGLPDNAIGSTDAAHAAGNHVLLSFGNNEYALLAHMQKGSVKVKTGDKVTMGQAVGLCGNSGNTSEPHLHFHVQDGPVLFHAKGLPVTFTDYLSNSKVIASGSPVKGDVIEAKP